MFSDSTDFHGGILCRHTFLLIQRAGLEMVKKEDIL